MFLHRHTPASKARTKDLLTQASHLASKGQRRQALELFKNCIKAYQDDDLPMRALAAAKAARSSLGMDPHLQAVIIQLYRSLDLPGDADQEIKSTLQAFTLHRNNFFLSLNQEHILAMLDIIDVQDLNKGENVYRQNERSADIYIVKNGRFEVIRNHQRIHVLTPGELFGETCYFHRNNRLTSVRALEPGTCVRIPAPKLRAVTENQPAIAKALEEFYAQRFIHSDGDKVAVKIDDLVDITELHVPQGSLIAAFEGVMIVKHGMVEIRYDEMGSEKKEIMGPGKILNISTGRAMASTDVHLIKAHYGLKSPLPDRP